MLSVSWIPSQPFQWYVLHENGAENQFFADTVMQTLMKISRNFKIVLRTAVAFELTTRTTSVASFIEITGKEMNYVNLSFTAVPRVAHVWLDGDDGDLQMGCRCLYVRVNVVSRCQLFPEVCHSGTCYMWKTEHAGKIQLEAHHYGLK